jgi:hypothetical protein
MTAPQTPEAVKVTVSMSATLTHNQRAYIGRQQAFDAVERAVCARSASCVTVETLRGKPQGRVYTMPRQWCWFILSNHPFFRDEYSSLRLGKLYNRDHTTVLSGLRRAKSFIAVRSCPEYARRLQLVCDDLQHIIGPFNIWHHCGFSDPRPRIAAPVMPKVAEAEPEPPAVCAELDERNRKIRALYKSGYDANLLAERFGRAQKTIREIGNMPEAQS